MRLTSVLICYFMGNNCITDETGILYSMKKEKFAGSQIEDCPIFALEIFFLDGMVQILQVQKVLVVLWHQQCSPLQRNL